MFNLRSLWSGSRTRSEWKAAPSAPPRFRPQLEGFEDRTVPAAPVFGPALAAPVNISPTFNFNLLQLNVGDVEVLNNALQTHLSPSANDMTLAQNAS
jgi:hypothetical protein